MTDNLLTLVDIADFRTLFIEELGWSNPDVASREITTSAGSHSLSVVASYKSLRIWYCSSLPDRKVQREIDHQLSLDNHERLVIFSNGDIQEWRWPRRAQLGGANAKLVLHRHKVGEPDLRLAKRLDAIRIDFEQPVTLVELLGRMRDAFDAESETASAEAARLMGTLYSELEAAGWTSHDATLLLGRVLFLYFGDDSGMWEAGAFERFLIDHTNTNDLAKNLEQLFDVVNTDTSKRELPNGSPFAGFRYINGGIFADPIIWGPLSEQFRDDLINAADFNWSLISPAVFGSMFQTVKSREARRHGGEHYTTEKNILRTIEPLFLDQLRAKLAGAWNDRGQLTKLHNELGHIRVLDPACGCGNFLIVAYRELRALELDLMLRRRELQYQVKEGDFAQLSFDVSGEIKVTLDHFYGIEIEEWPARIAETALLLMDHLANLRMADDFGDPPDRLPIRIAPTIVKGNALEVDWQAILPASDSTLVFGNPPFLGHDSRTAEQATELRNLWGDEIGRIDYVTGWYAKAINYFGDKHDGRWAFVSTNSVTQGQPVPLVFGRVFAAGWHISFAHRTFAWTSEAPGPAAVHCVIIGYSRSGTDKARLFDYNTLTGDPIERAASTINAYLIDGPNLLVKARSAPLSSEVSKVSFGSRPNDGGGFIIEPKDFGAVMADPIAAKYVRKYTGARELLHDESRWVLWLIDVDPDDLSHSAILKERVERTKNHRLASKRQATRDWADRATLFDFNSQPSVAYLAIPGASSENRRYLATKRFDADVISSNLVYTTPDADGFVFAAVSSAMFMTWQKAIGGRLKSDIRFSNTLVWNNFPMPAVSGKLRQQIIEAGQGVNAAREAHPERTLAQHYNALAMAPDLYDAHARLDALVDKAFGGSGKLRESERQSLLFKEFKAQAEAGQLVAAGEKSGRRQTAAPRIVE